MSTFSMDFLEKKIPFFHIFKEIDKKYNAGIYFAGGLVRDIILEKNINDIDIVAENIEYTELAKITAKYIKSYPVAFKDNMRLMKKNVIIDISKIRGRNIYEDVLKRDFTINNLALSTDGTLIGDTKDIDNGIIKTVTDTSLTDDPLRIIRALRFASTYGFTIEPNTLMQAVSLKNLITTCAKERVLEEFRKIFKGRFLHSGLNVIYNSNILSPLLDISKINNSSLINAVKYSDDFSLLLAVWTKDRKFIDYLNLSLNEQKNINIYLNMDYNTLKNASIDILTDYVFRNHSLIKNISLYTALNYQNSELASTLIEIDNGLDYKKAQLINGKLLIDAGYRPSPLFSKIIDETAFLLAKGDLNEHNILDYINKKWGRL